MRRSRKKSAIVPGLVLSASFIAVVPAIACSGPDPITSNRTIQYGVAAVAYCCFEAGGVADVGFRPESGVADVAFIPDTSTEADAPSDAPGDVKEGG